MCPQCSKRPPNLNSRTHPSGSIQPE
jgi:hypothetical protein